MAADKTSPSNGKVTNVSPARAAGYNKIDASAMVRKANVWRLNLLLSITHHDPKRFANPVIRLTDMTKRAV